MNGWITGDLLQAILQAFLATLLGFWIAALRLYLNTLIPLILIHWLWDFGILAAAPSKVASVDGVFIGSIIVVEIVLCAYGLWLVHAYRNAHDV